jgi:hypothetical protein
MLASAADLRLLIGERMQTRRRFEPNAGTGLVNRCLGCARNLRQAKSTQEVHSDHGIVENSPRIRPEVI